MSKALTLELIHMKTKTNRIDSIKNLNLWGNDLDDISIVNQMNALEVLSLSVNNISTLKDVQNCYNLRELYLRKNSLSDIQEVRYLQPLRKLRILWLGENPIADIQGYRQFVIKCLPQIEKLDNDMISGEEKQRSDNVDLDDFGGQVPQSKISPPRKEQLQAYNQPPKRAQTQFQAQQDFSGDDMMDNFVSQKQPQAQFAYGGGGKVQRSPPQSKRNIVQDGYNSPRSNNRNDRNISPQENFGGAGAGFAAAKVKHSPKQSYQQQYDSQLDRGIGGGMYDEPPRQYEQQQQQRKPYQQAQQQMPHHNYQRAQTAQVDYERNEQSPIGNKKAGGGGAGDLTGQLQPHQVREKKNGTREQFRNENILCAIIALMKELDKSGLEFVKKDCEKRLQKLE
ncbi:leucine rich repeat family protein [Stylonychia lemnae]|uniref:Leucine rich repeat family protein n=1 Tax=Stylonychia lemnae TaxID=5949 RepID=A0A078AS33_STYLE|nr:leucine rich repeat family protein [Stylonychia lemnae]|eukprot:CDW84017.1 leucine rich repeat family protein [Stylonychia lemnae]